MDTYQHKQQPFRHQAAHFDAYRESEYRGLFWEQGCGKTKPIIDTVSWLFLAARVDCALVVAPPGVDLNWLTDELPAHMPDVVLGNTCRFQYRAKKAGTKWHKALAEAALRHDGLSFVTISYESFMTERGKQFVWRLLRRRKCLFALDESDNVKTPKAKRTRSIIAAGKYASYRRIATGTPITLHPFDVYSQIRFLREDYWRENGCGSTFAEFKRYFGVWLTRAEAQEQLGYDPGYDKLIRYKNLDRLKELVAAVADRLTKEEVLPDLPPKLYVKRRFELSAEQRRLYDDLRKNFIVEMEAGLLDGTLAMVRLLRLQQIACGYAVTDAEEPTVLLGQNPRMESLVELLKGLSHPAIIWARFRHDIDQIMEATGYLGMTAVRYDGAVSEEERAIGKASFQAGETQFFVSNPQAGGSGLTLTQARTVIYYSNSFKLKDRLQSEDRAHRIGQHNAVEYVDLMAEDTVDEKLISSLRDKRDIAATVLGDELREWI